MAAGQASGLACSYGVPHITAAVAAHRCNNGAALGFRDKPLQTTSGSSFLQRGEKGKQNSCLANFFLQFCFIKKQLIMTLTSSVRWMVLRHGVFTCYAVYMKGRGRKKRVDSREWPELTRDRDLQW